VVATLEDLALADAVNHVGIADRADSMSCNPSKSAGALKAEIITDGDCSATP
jgi:hypothetical protein